MPLRQQSHEICGHQVVCVQDRALQAADVTRERKQVIQVVDLAIARDASFERGRQQRRVMPGLLFGPPLQKRIPNHANGGEATRWAHLPLPRHIQQPIAPSAALPIGEVREGRTDLLQAGARRDSLGSHLFSEPLSEPNLVGDGRRRPHRRRRRCRARLGTSGGFRGLLQAAAAQLLREHGLQRGDLALVQSTQHWPVQVDALADGVATPFVEGNRILRPEVHVVVAERSRLLLGQAHQESAQALPLQVPRDDDKGGGATAAHGASIEGLVHSNVTYALSVPSDHIAAR
mmetsp:Transcript_143799/g.460335  ORF Transcript_143799/g.460335 Transcript_143799/m.460335 type:complete len:289 (-) Transcript_143799:402-1268(-)